MFSLSYRVEKVWQRDFTVWKRFWISSLIGMLGEPLLYFVAIGYGLGLFIGQIGGVSYIEFLAPALVAVAIMNTASAETTYHAFTRMQKQKTYQSIAYTPVNIPEVVAGDILWGATRGSMSGVAMYLVSLALGLAISPWVMLVIPLIFIIGMVFASLGMIATSMAKDYDFFIFFFILFIEPMFLFSGTFFPLSSLPWIVQKIAWFFPLTHAVILYRGLYRGEIGLDLLWSFIWIVVFAVLIFFTAVWRMTRRIYI